MKKKLCYIISEYNLNTDSHYFHIYELLENISREIDVFLFIETGHSFSPPSYCRYYVQRFNFLPLSFAERIAVLTIIRIFGYNNFYSHYSIFSSLLAALICKLTFGKAYFWYSQYYGSHPHNIIENIAFKVNLWLVSYLVTSNKAMKNYFSSNFAKSKEKIKVFPLWVNISTFRKDKKKRGNTILFVHSLSKRKGADLVVPIGNQIFKKNRLAKLWVIGSGELEKEVRGQISASPYKNRFLFIGKISNSQIYKYYNSSDIFLMTSREEEHPRVLLEAMASDLPIVSSKTTGTEEILSAKQKKFTFPFTNKYALAKSVNKILQDKELYNSLVVEGQKVITKHDLTIGLKNFKQLFYE